MCKRHEKIERSQAAPNDTSGVWGFQSTSVARIPGLKRETWATRFVTWSFFSQLGAGKLAAPNEQNDSSISIRYWEGETADSSASLGMTKGRTALSLNLVVPPTIPMDVVHFSLYLPQASRGAPNEQNDFSISIRYWEGETADSSASLGMTKGRDGALLEFGGPTNYPNGCRSFLPLLAAGKSRCSG